MFHYSFTTHYLVIFFCPHTQQSLSLWTLLSCRGEIMISHGHTMSPAAPLHLLTINEPVDVANAVTLILTCFPPTADVYWKFSQLRYHCQELNHTFPHLVFVPVAPHTLSYVLNSLLSVYVTWQGNRISITRQGQWLQPWWARFHFTELTLSCTASITVDRYLEAFFEPFQL